MVNVPVLSITIALIFLIFSKAVASFIKILFSAALPIPTIKAVGVASPIAHGQAITNTATAAKMAFDNISGPPIRYHTRNVMRDKQRTIGTKINAILSTIR